MVYSLALVVALIAGVAALLNAAGGESETTARAEADPLEVAVAPGRGESSGERTDGAGEPDADGRASDLRPILPPVPDLEREPPPAREPSEPDPRFAELGVEMRVLSRARELLEEHPAEAFSVLEEHRRRFPQGALREEREAFSVQALVNLGRVQEAERRYYEFLHDFPHSDFAERLSRLMRRAAGAHGR